jgi:hypothetical protein
VIVLRFKSGQVPFSFEAFITSLTDDKSLGWHLLKQDKQREAEFRIELAFDVKLIALDSCLEIRVSQVGDTELFLQDVCVKMREIIGGKIKAIYPEKDSFKLAFLCTCHQIRDSHMMEVEDSTMLHPRAVCLHAPLHPKLSEDTHLLWFVSPHQKNTCRITKHKFCMKLRF